MADADAETVDTDPGTSDTDPRTVDTDPEAPDTNSEPVDTNQGSLQTDPQTPVALLARAERYAETVPLAVDLDSVEWEISHRAKRRAGACIYRESTGVATIRLTWAAYEAFGWTAFTETIRHELIHAYEFQTHGESGHGPRFRELADELEVTRHCPRFTEPRYWVVCAECENRIGRHRRSKLVEQPERYRCECGGRLAVRESE